jgi:tRNA modification GTPase
VIDGSRPLPEGAGALFERVARLPGVFALHQRDRGLRLGAREIEGLTGGHSRVHTSSETGEGIEELRREIVRSVRSRSSGLVERGAAPNVRQANLLDRAAGALERAARGASEGLPLEMIALEIREGAEALGEITGEAFTEGLLDRIFADFCIGK